jgi:signal transduction histidine kinase
MWHGTSPSQASAQRLLPYIADLELEVDRLRRQGQFLQQTVREAVRRIEALAQPESATNDPARAEIGRAARELICALGELRDLPGYHPAHDQVVPIAVRPLVEQVFRWQQRLQDAPGVVLRLELANEHVEWFPGRLRHILDNLISNALKYRDPSRAESWVHLRLESFPGNYELQVTDNGLGLPSDQNQLFELFYRAAPARAAGLGVGLPVVKLLVEQSGGSLTVRSTEGQGSVFVLVLPRYEVDDYLQ